MKYGIKKETTQENIDELTRMQSELKQFDVNCEPYRGMTNDIDLYLDWFCPHCLGVLKVGRMAVRDGCIVGAVHKKTKSDREYDVLYCPDDKDGHEYYFYNKDLRVSASVCWIDKYQYPLNPMQYHQKKIDAVRKNIADSTYAIANLKEKIVEQQCSLKELESQSHKIIAVMQEQLENQKVTEF